MRILAKSTSQTYKLAFDPTGESSVTIRQARNGDEIRLSRLTEQQAWRDGKGGRELVINWNQRERERMMAFMTLVAADLEFEDENGKVTPVFKFREGKNGPEIAMTEPQFNTAWDNLPAPLVDEIVEHIIDCNPQWGSGSGE